MQILTLTFIVITTLFLIWIIIMKNNNNHQTKNSCFECGFESSNTTFIPFSSQYFTVAMIFLIFDLEIVLTIPIPLSSQIWTASNTLILFLLILTIILLNEIFHSSVDWSN